jgi:hypothetical protein
VFATPVTGHTEEQGRPLFSGQATGARVQVLTLPAIVIADTGPIPDSGDERDAVLAEVAIPGELTGGILTLNAEVLPATVVAGDDTSRAEASLATLDATVAVAGSTTTISADLLHARASASCGANGAVVTASSEIVTLVINGQPIVVSGTPNQTITLPNGLGVVIINEQLGGNTGGAGDITVNALHVVVNNPLTGEQLADVIIGSAHADILCQGPPACAGLRDFVTGGGFITGTPSGGRANFAVAGGIKNGAPFGHLVYHDRAAALKVKGTGVTSYTVTGPTSRHIQGTCEINGVMGTYDVDVADNGEPGRQDNFRLVLSNEYVAFGTLAGGNIQLHGKCPK